MSVNIVLVPALLLLVGLVFYKKVLEPRRAGERTSKPQKATKTQTTAKPRKAEKAPKTQKAAKSRQMSSSGRMGSVL